MLTQTRLKELIHYNPDTGIFTRLVNIGGGKKGKTAGCIRPDGYKRIQIDGKGYFTSRLAHLYMEGFFPEHEMDHKNGLRDDDRWNNLRHVSRKCNMQNCGLYSRNKSGYNGVSFCKQTGRWQAGIQINRRSFNLGQYDTALEAAVARIEEEDRNPDWHCDERNINRKKVFQALEDLKSLHKR